MSDDRSVRVIELNLAIQLLILLGSVGAVGAVGYAALSVLQSQVAVAVRDQTADREAVKQLSVDTSAVLKSISKDIADMRVELAKAGRR